MGVVREEREMDEEAHKLIVIREDEMEVVENPNNDDLAEEVQMQELLFFLLQPQEHEHEVLESPQDSGTPIILPNSPIEESIEEPIEEPIIETIDPKGKQQVEFIASYITEKGESSKIIHENFCCPICMELIPTSDGFSINPCDHIFCISCMIHYITVKTEENAVTIPCPIPGCESTSLDPETCQHILPKDTFDRWNLTLCESSLGPNKFYCPFKDCSALLVEEEGETITNCECPHCNRMLCAKCKVPWHGDMSCEEYERLGEDERGREDLMLRNLAKDKRWQRCSKCRRMYVERIDGCAFMKCSKMARTRASTSIENPKPRTKRQRLERGEQSREETSDCKGKRRDEGGGDNDVRSGADDVLLLEELQKLERGKQSREGTSDRKGKRKEEGGYEGIFLTDSADDVLLSEELQIQEILFMTMQSKEGRGESSFGDRGRAR